MSKKQVNFTLLTFLTSTSTLLCCTLPALLSLIAGSTAVASLITTFPLLITISKYHGWIFIVAGVLLTINGWLLYRHGRACPIEGKQYCEPTTKVARIIFWVSVLIYCIGFLFAYILPYLLYGIS